MIFFKKPFYFLFWATGMFYQFLVPISLKYLQVFDELTSVIVGVLLASSFADLALTSSIIRASDLSIRGLLSSRVVLYVLFLSAYSVIFNLSVLIYLTGCFVSPALVSFMYSRGYKQLLKLMLFIRVISFVPLFFGYPLLSLFLYSGAFLGFIYLCKSIICLISGRVGKFYHPPSYSRLIAGELLLSFISSFISGFISNGSFFDLVVERVYRLVVGIAVVVGDLVFYKNTISKIRKYTSYFVNGFVASMMMLFGFSCVLLVQETNLIAWMAPLIGLFNYCYGKFVLLPIYGYNNFIFIILLINFFSVCFYRLLYFSNSVSIVLLLTDSFVVIGFGFMCLISVKSRGKALI